MVILCYRLLASSLEVLDGCISTVSSLEDGDPLKVTTQQLATQLLILPTPSGVQQFTKTLLASLHPNKTSYHNHKVSGVTWF